MIGNSSDRRRVMSERLPRLVAQLQVHPGEAAIQTTHEEVLKENKINKKAFRTGMHSSRACEAPDVVKAKRS